MINFKQYLEEGRDAPLYHSTQVKNAAKILKNNSLKPLTTQEFATKHNKEISNKTLKGVSLTRSLNFAHEYWDGIIFELDQSKLVHNHQIVPFNYFASGVEKTSKNPARFSDKKYRDMNEFEEFVVGEIKPLSRYITKVICTSRVFENLSNFADDEVAIIINHPKLYIGGKFINA